MVEHEQAERISRRFALNERQHRGYGNVSYMPSSRSAQLLSRLGPLKRMPVLKLLAAAEIMMLAREHMARLEPHERRRMIDLVRRGRGRPRNLSDRERDELARLIDKAGPRQLVGKVADRLSPFPLPGRVVNGRRKRSR